MTTLPKPKTRRWYTRWWFWLIVVIMIITIISGISGALSYKDFQKEQFSYLEEVVVAEKRILKKTISTNGQLASDNSSQLIPARPGRVTEINTQVGDEVSKDDILLKLDTGEQIKAPFDGTVLSVNTFVNDVATGGTPVLVVGFRSNHVEFMASESEVLDLRTGQHVTLTVPAVDEREKYDGTVEFVDVKKQTVQQSISGSAGAMAGGAATESGYLIKVSADQLPEYARNVIGLSIDLIVDIYQTESVLSLEPSAVQYNDNDEPFVYLPPEINEAFIAKATAAEHITDILEKQPIDIGFKGDEYIQITGGLEEGDEVLLFIPNGADQSFGLF